MGFYMPYTVEVLQTFRSGPDRWIPRKSFQYENQARRYAAVITDKAVRITLRVKGPIDELTEDDYERKWFEQLVRQ